MGLPTRMPARGPGSIEELGLNALASEIIGPRTGILGGVHQHAVSAGDIAAHHVVAVTGSYGRLPGGGDISGAGGSFYSRRGAYQRGMFEALERYCGAFWDAANLLLSTPAPGGPFLYGDKLPIFADFQYDQPGFEFRPLTAQSKIHWWEGRSLVTGQLWYVPACLVPVPSHPITEDEKLGPAMSLGMAAGDTWAKACLRGLFEICERDAFAILWFNQLSMPRLRIRPGSALGRSLAGLLEGHDARLTFINETNDLGIPTVLAMYERDLLGKPLVTFGASAQTSLEVAAGKAALEAFSGYNRIRQEHERSSGFVAAADYSNIEDYVHHALVYADPGIQPALGFITASQVVEDLEQMPRSPAGTPAELLLHYVKQIAGRGEDVIVVNLTTRDVAAVGVHVVKVIVPGAVPLNPRHQYPHLGHPRMYTVPRELGYRDRDTTPGELALHVPHPFP